MVTAQSETVKLNQSIPVESLSAANWFEYEMLRSANTEYCNLSVHQPVCRVQAEK